MIKSIVLFTLACAVALGIYLFFHLGAHKSVELSVIEREGLNILYKDHTGAYHKIASVIESVEKWAQLNNIKCEQTFGQYLDDPNVTEEPRLRSRGGCVVDDFTFKTPADFKTGRVSGGYFLQAIFEGSPAIGPFKVYPKAEDWMVTNRRRQEGSVLELYDILGPDKMTTTYLFPLAPLANQ